MSDEKTQASAEVANLIERLFVLMRTLGAHGGDHPMAAKSAERVRECVARLQPPFSLQFVAEGLFRDRHLVPLDVETFARVRRLERALSNLEVHEVTFEVLPPVAVLLQFGEALARGRLGRADALHTLKLKEMRWREIPDARRGFDTESVDPEVFAAAQVSQSIAGSEELLRRVEEPWPWPLGVGVVRRLQRAVSLDPVVSAQVIELAPGGWTVARRATSACLQALTLASAVDVSISALRAAGHAALALAIQGYEERGAKLLPDAGGELVERMMASPVTARSGVEPHRLRTTALVYQASGGDVVGNRPLEITHLIELAFRLEAQRWPPGLEAPLTKGDLLAQEVLESGSDAGPWLRVLVKTAGEVPPGARVRLADGRRATVLGPSDSGDPWRPLVLVGGRAAVPAAPVRLDLAES